MMKNWYILVSQIRTLSAGAVEYADCTSAEGYILSTGAMCLPWVETHKTLGRNPGGWAVNDPATETHHFDPYLVWRT